MNRKQIFLTKLGACSCCAHLFLLIFLFLVRGEQFTQRINFSLPANVKFVYVPFRKQISTLQGQGVITQQEIQAPVKSKTVMAKRVAGKKKVKKPKSKAKRPPCGFDTIAPQSLTTNGGDKAPSKVDNQAPSNTDPIEIGALELDALELAQNIREEVVRVWQPPAGLAIGRQCTIKLLLDWQGNIEDLTIAESSTVPAFDTSVKLAVRAMKFPKAVFGKELILPFGA